MDINRIKSQYSDPIFIDRFQQVFNISIFLGNSIIRDSFNPTKEYINAISLTKEGKLLFEKLKANFEDIEDQTIVLAIFLKFFHIELFIDVLNTDIKLLTKIVNNSIISREILFPWIYGRLLYDKYFEEFEEQEETLDNTKVLKLLENTYQGVFQIGNTIIGPLGIRQCNIKRIIPPTRTVKLWHCSDPSCEAFHNVRLQSGKTKINDVSELIHEIYSKASSSDWDDFHMTLIENDNYYYSPDRYDDISITIVNAFGSNEMKLITKSIIDTVKDFRNYLPNEKKFKGPSDRIISNIDKSVCFQLILLCDNKNIIEITERLISEQQIKIPNTEIRASKIIKKGGYYNISHQCNMLGFRSISTRIGLAIPRLKNLLINIYQQPMLKQQLEWQLRYISGDSFEQKIDEYLKKADPIDIINETILNGPVQLNKTFELLYGHFSIPENKKDEQTLINKILWKLGFDINIYPIILSSFWERLELLKAVSKEKSEYDEIDKDKIRSAAVNLFVSLEEILKHSLSFTTWLLLSDHFLESKFRYNFETARVFMTQTLNGYKIGTSEQLIFDLKGHDTLFPLIEGFNALFDYCDKLLLQDHKLFLRPQNQLPHFSNKAQLSEFPFLNKIFLFDLNRDNYQAYKNIALNIPLSFNQNNVLSIRNRLEHHREDFPSQKEIVEACESIEKEIIKIEKNSIFPNVFLYKSSETDKYKRVIYKFEDYNKRIITICPVTDFSGCSLPNYRVPQIILPILKLGKSTEPLRIEYQENSEYLNYWMGFPRKKVKVEKSADFSISENNE